MTYAFVLDASACSGCKACQVACKDKNRLPLGVLWRRVYEVSGGSWKQEGAAWTSTVFSYNLSLACNHCVHPKCAGVCPVNAYTVRPDGIVTLDSSKCVGCGYCAWACPYGAPQYDRAAGYMTKCDFCSDNLDAGLPPACVAACPLRVLDYMEVDDGQPLPALAAGQIALWATPPAAYPFPLPRNSFTQPHLAIKPHPAMSSIEAKRTANLEEIHPAESASAQRSGHVSAPFDEAPLVAFTLLVQMAVGGFWAMLWLFPDVGQQLLPMLLIGLCLGFGLLASFAHLGARRNAWRVLNNLRKSRLSREILYSLLFGLGWLVTLVTLLLHGNPAIPSSLTALIGLGLIDCMSQVYRLRTVPAWNSWRTEFRFFLSAALLGILGMAPLLAWMHIRPVQWPQAGLLALALLITQAIVTWSKPLSLERKPLQLGLILLALSGCAALFFLPAAFQIYSALVVLLLVIVEEILGRWLFYAARTSP